MPPAKRHNWERPKIKIPRSTTTTSGTIHSLSSGQPQDKQQHNSVSMKKVTALERRQLFARLLWLGDYHIIYGAERDVKGTLLDVLKTNYTSVYTQRLMLSPTVEGMRAVAAVEGRLGDCIGFLERSRSRLHI